VFLIWFPKYFTKPIYAAVVLYITIKIFAVVQYSKLS
jgi:hypothetical protein